MSKKTIKEKNIVEALRTSSDESVLPTEFRAELKDQLLTKAVQMKKPETKGLFRFRYILPIALIAVAAGGYWYTQLRPTENETVVQNDRVAEDTNESGEELDRLTGQGNTKEEIEDISQKFEGALNRKDTDVYVDYLAEDFDLDVVGEDTLETFDERELSMISYIELLSPIDFEAEITTKELGTKAEDLDLPISEYVFGKSKIDGSIIGYSIHSNVDHFVVIPATNAEFIAYVRENVEEFDDAVLGALIAEDVEIENNLSESTDEEDDEQDSRKVVLDLITDISVTAELEIEVSDEVTVFTFTSKERVTTIVVDGRTITEVRAEEVQDSE